MIHIIFDLDGTLADTQRIHQQIESDFLASKGVYIEPANIGIAYAGRSPSEWIPECLGEHNAIYDPQEVTDFVHTKDTIVVDALEKNQISLLRGVYGTLCALRDRGVKMGISSGACRKFIDIFIEKFHLDMIDTSTSADEVKNKKPAPDVFLNSFHKLEKVYGVPDEKWVIGDGKSDIIGGKAAGAKTILCFGDYDIGYNYKIDNFSDIVDIVYKQ